MLFRSLTQEPQKLPIMVTRASETDLNNMVKQKPVEQKQRGLSGKEKVMNFFESAAALYSRPGRIKNVIKKIRQYESLDFAHSVDQFN